MKIAVVKRRYSLRHGGSERYCVNLSRRLIALGHDVTVIGVRIDEELQNEVGFVPVRVNNLTSWSSNQSFAEGCGRAVRDGRFDIVYGLGRAFGLDAVRVTDRLQSHWLSVYYRNRINRRLQSWNPRHRTLIGLERRIYRSDSVRRIVAQSQLDRRLVIEHYRINEDKIRVVYNGVDTEVFHPGVRADAEQVRRGLGVPMNVPLVVYASMDFKGKGLRSTFRALKTTKHREAWLLVLGTGPVRQFARIARDMGISDRVIFGGHRSNIQQYYGAGDLFVLPSTYEPFPNVNLEAMACGLPVLTTATTGGAEVIVEGTNGYLIPHVNAVEEMVARLDHHLGLPATQRAAMSEGCWSTAQQMTVEKNVRKTLDVFEEVLLEKFRV